ncbi:hypothetical protein HY091_00200, partial [Candidatus Kaiserbacteria bacterium]|nr:hypothetical protein [Candidatus Kaiserbacteria bacterium]
LLDIIADHSVFAVVVLGLVYQGLLSGALGIAYVYLYILLIGCTIAQNALQQPVPTFVRTKYGLYAVYGLYALTGLSWFNFAAGVSIVLAVVPLLISVKSLSKHLV